jgi:RNA polymerase sigma-70 factor (ECF subfamily)
VRHRSERQNLGDIRKGQRQAYEAVVCQNYKAIYRFMAYLTQDTHLAEDLTQETFASAWANINGFKGRASFGTWLHQIAYRKFIDSRRRLQREAALATRLKEEEDDSEQRSNPLLRLAADENSRILYAAIRTLNSSEYMVIVLHYIQGLSYREMAEILDVPIGTVKWQTSRALKNLKKHLSGRI